MSENTDQDALITQLSQATGLEPQMVNIPNYGAQPALFKLTADLGYPVPHSQ